MPTTSFIYETVQDRHHERGGEAPRPPARFSCPECGEELGDPTALAVHVGSAHPLGAPRLVISDSVVVGERLIHRRVAADAVELANAGELLVSENGGPRQPWSLAALRQTLAEADSLVLDVTLKNHRAGDGAAAVERVRLVVDIPDEAAMDSVDRAFDELLACEELDEYRLDAFADAVSEAPRALRYGSALHDYGVALLIKDRANGTADLLPFERHRSKLQAALHVLREYPERPLARAVSGFVRFGLNDFGAADRASGVPVLDRCVIALGELVGADPEHLVEPSEVVTGRCPTDTMTSFILEHFNDPSALPELVARASSSGSTVDDAAKCRALAVLLASANSAAAADLARPLVNDLVFGAWASQIVDNATRHE